MAIMLLQVEYLGNLLVSEDVMAAPYPHKPKPGRLNKSS